MLSLETKKKIPHVVLAEDDPDECMIFMDALESLNVQYIFSLAENGAMLLNMLDENEFSSDVIFINLNMRGISGKDCLLAIRTSEKLDKTPVILYAKSVDSLEINYSYNASSNLFIVKDDFVLNLGDLLETALQLPLCEFLPIEKDDFTKNTITH